VENPSSAQPKQMMAEPVERHFLISGECPHGGVGLDLYYFWLPVAEEPRLEGVSCCPRNGKQRD
jgi:hypothetical protein